MPILLFFLFLHFKGSGGEAAWSQPR